MSNRTENPIGSARNWTKEEKDYLEEHWGSLSIGTIMKNLNRSKNAVNVMVYRLGLGAFLKNGGYITWNQLHIALGNEKKSGSGYKMISWVQNREFPLHTKRVGDNSFKIVYIDEFWEWARKNKDLLDFSKLEENLLGKEPDWVNLKRKHDYEVNRKYKKTPWTKTEDEKLSQLLKKYKYGYSDLSKMLNRTCGAIQRRICDLGLKERPLRADNHTKWTKEEFEILEELIKFGYGYELIAEKIGKSSKAVRGLVYRIYSTERLDKVREKMMEE